MLQNYLKIALRSLTKHRFFTVLNIGGLALGMSCCLTVILIVRDQLNYDTFHPQSDRICRVNTLNADMKIATSPYPMGDALKSDFSMVASTVRLVRSMQGTDATTKTGLTLGISGFFTEPSFFSIFGFQLKSGNSATVLSEPNTIVLSEKVAAHFFGNNNPIGEILTLKGKGTYTVTGVVAETPGKTHIEFDCLASVSSLEAIEQQYAPEEAQEKVLDNWENHFMSYLYVLLQPGKTKADLDHALATIAATRHEAGKSDKDAVFFAQNFDKITPKPEIYANELGGGAPWFFIWGLSAFVLILTIFPCLNYANLALAQALARSKEVGIRKAIGAGNMDVKKLVWAEAILTSLIALVFAFLLHFPLNHFVMDYFPARANLDNLHAGPVDWLIFIAFALLVGFLAGWLPARRLSRINTLTALRSNSAGQSAGRSRVNWRTTMLVGQFSMALIFMIVVVTLWSQMEYMSVANYGFDKSNLLTVEVQGNKTDVVADEFAKNPYVTGVTRTSVLIASNNLQGVPLKRQRGGEPDGNDWINCAAVDENYIPVMGLQLVAGENFEKMAKGTRENAIIVNEKALEPYQLGTAAEAIGKTLWLNDSTPVAVRGVLKDFNYRILEERIEPFALRCAPMEHHLIHVRIAPGDPQKAMASLEASWNKLDVIHEFKATFMEESIQKAYGHVTLVGGLISFFALMALSLACAGLLGMVTYTVSTKMKEIGVRKVLGASVPQITFTLSRHFLVLLGIATGLAIPVGYWLSGLFLNMFAYHISVGFMVLGGSATMVLALGLLAIGVQAVRAASANPVEVLRRE